MMHVLNEIAAMIRAVAVRLFAIQLDVSGTSGADLTVAFIVSIVYEIDSRKLAWKEAI